jgi:hypothetical protein
LIATQKNNSWSLGIVEFRTPQKSGGTPWGLEPKREYFDDFLACKFIRNAYVHGEWNENQRTYVESRNFPSTTMTFSPQHYVRIKECYYHLLNKLGRAQALDTIMKKKLGN